jgi:hypothetical protein
MIKYLIAGLFLLTISSPLAAQIWQWSVPVKTARNAGARAYLWIPADCNKIKAVVLAQNNMD